MVKNNFIQHALQRQPTNFPKYDCKILKALKWKVLVLTSAGDHGSHLQERDDQSGRDEQIPEDSLCAGLQLQDRADLQGLQHTAL